MESKDSQSIDQTIQFSSKGSNESLGNDDENILQSDSSSSSNSEITSDSSSGEENDKVSVEKEVAWKTSSYFAKSSHHEIGKVSEPLNENNSDGIPYKNPKSDSQSDEEYKLLFPHVDAIVEIPSENRSIATEANKFPSCMFSDLELKTGVVKSQEKQEIDKMALESDPRFLMKLKGKQFRTFFDFKDVHKLCVSCLLLPIFPFDSHTKEIEVQEGLNGSNIKVSGFFAAQLKLKYDRIQSERRIDLLLSVEDNFNKIHALNLFSDKAQESTTISGDDFIGGEINRRLCRWEFYQYLMSKGEFGLIYWYSLHGRNKDNWNGFLNWRLNWDISCDSRELRESYLLFKGNNANITVRKPLNPYFDNESGLIDICSDSDFVIELDLEKDAKIQEDMDRLSDLLNLTIIEGSKLFIISV